MMQNDEKNKEKSITLTHFIGEIDFYYKKYFLRFFNYTVVSVVKVTLRENNAKR